MDIVSTSMNVPRAPKPWFLVKDRKFLFFWIGNTSFSNLLFVYDSDNDGKAPPVEYLSPDILADFVCNELLPQLDEPLLTENAHHIKSYLIQNAINSEKLSTISERMDEFIQFMTERVNGLKVEIDDDIELLKEVDAKEGWILTRNREDRNRFFQAYERDILVDRKFHIFKDMDDETFNRFKEKWETYNNMLKEPLEFKDASMVLLEQLQGELRVAVKWTHIASAVAHEMTNALATKINEVSKNLNPPYRYCTELVNAVNAKRVNNLTVVETRYLEALIQRACPLRNQSPMTLNAVESYVYINDGLIID